MNFLKRQKLSFPQNTILDHSAPYKGKRILYSRKFSSAKNFVKVTVRQFVRNLFSSKAGRRSFALCSFAYRLSSHSWIFLIPHLCMLWFVRNICQEFNLVKKLLWRSDEIKFLTKISCYIVADFETWRVFSNELPNCRKWNGLAQLLKKFRKVKIGKRCRYSEIQRL